MAYTSPYGTGDRQSVIAGSLSAGIIANLDPNSSVEETIDGIKGTIYNWLRIYYVDSSGEWIKYQFDEAIIITEIVCYWSGTSGDWGVWKFQGSNNNADWDDLGTSFTLCNATTQTIAVMSGNTTAYTYYRFLGISGNMNYNVALYEIEFSWSYPADASDIKTFNGIAYTNIKSVDGVAIASIKSIDGVA